MVIANYFFLLPDSERRANPSDTNLPPLSRGENRFGFLRVSVTNHVPNLLSDDLSAENRSEFSRFGRVFFAEKHREEHVIGSAVLLLRS